MGNCRDCEHWERKDIGEGKVSDAGYCHRDPSVFMGSVMSQSKLGQPLRQDNWGHPFMLGSDYCGGYELSAKLTVKLEN